MVLLGLACGGCGSVVRVDDGGPDSNAPGAYDGVAILHPELDGAMVEVRVGSPAPTCALEMEGVLGFGEYLATVQLEPKMQHDAAAITLHPSSAVVGLAVGARPNISTGGWGTSGELRVDEFDDEVVTLELRGVGVFPPANDHPQFTVDFDGTYTALRCR
jgi:hypothetical protein